MLHVPSPRRYVELEAVPEPNLAVPTVPLDRLDAFSAVKAEPLPEKLLADSVDVPAFHVNEDEPAKDPELLNWT